jgi:DNA-directed RNA polymerase subunit RPC12/RpoP
METTDFKCSTCEAVYKLLTIEAPAADDKPIECVSCGAPLVGRNGRFALKYIRVNGGRRARAAVKEAP